MATSTAELNSRREIAKTLESCIYAIDSNGSFCAQRTPFQLNPGLEVDGIDGTIGIPISGEDAKRLIASSRQAPFGKDDKTIVDTTVRNTWEIDASQVRLLHPDWSSAQQGLLTQVCHELGVPGGSNNVRAELYKLLVYEEGAMFKPHQDSEKADGMFATMIISLPCAHDGGDVVVSFKGQRKVLRTAPNSRWYCTCLAWYSDVVHEVTPVNSGYRIVLTYNVIQTGSAPAPCARDSKALAKLQGLRDLLRRWSAAASADGVEWEEDAEGNPISVPEHLVYLLEHEYTQPNLRLEQLKGRDRARIQALASLEQEGECVCYLASIEKWRVGDTGECEDGYWWSSHRPGNEDYGSDEDESDEFHKIVELIDETLKIKHLVTLDGRPATEHFDLHDHDFVHEDIWDDREPDSQDWSGFTGNEGVTSEHWYHESVVIIVPMIDDGSVAAEDDAADLEEVRPADPECVAGTKRKLEDDKENVYPCKLSGSAEEAATLGE